MGKRKVHFWDYLVTGNFRTRCGMSTDSIPAPNATNVTKVVTCARCLRTKAYREAVKAVEEKRG